MCVLVRHLHLFNPVFINEIHLILMIGDTYFGSKSKIYDLEMFCSLDRRTKISILSLMKRKHQKCSNDACFVRLTIKINT